MIKYASSARQRDSGFTLVELLMALILTSFLALAVSKMFGESISAMQYNQATSLAGAGTSTLNTTFSRDMRESNGFSIPGYAAAVTVTSAVGSGGTVTYIASNYFSVNQVVSITGLTTTSGVSLNLTSQRITSATSTQFTVSNAAVGTAASLQNGKAVLEFTVTAASGNGTTVTYTAANTLLTGQVVTITGLTTAALNLTAVEVTSATATSFSVTDPTVGTAAATQSGKAILQQPVVSSAVGDGTYITYTYSGGPDLVVGENITVSGMPAGYNYSNVAVLQSTSTTFQILGTTVGSVNGQAGLLSIGCTTWDPTDAGFNSVRPLLVVSQSKSASVYAATGDGATITFSYAGQDVYAVGQNITVSGLSVSGLNVTNATITSVNGPANTFSVTGAGIGTVSQTTDFFGTPVIVGYASFNQFVGYEVHANAGSGELWRIQCLAPGRTKTGANSQKLRAPMPLPTDSSWIASMQCTTYSASAVVVASPGAASCPVDNFLGDSSLYPGVTFTVPAGTGIVVGTSNTRYDSQTILGARSV